MSKLKKVSRFIVINAILSNNVILPVTVKEFVRAAFDGRMSVIEKYVKNGSDVNIQDDAFGYCHTALIEAARGKRTKIVNYLLAKKANVNLKDIWGQNVLSFIISPPLFYKEDSEYFDIAKAILNRPEIEINNQNNDGNTPLHQAVLFNDYRLIKLLLAKGAKTDIKNKVGETPIEKAKKDKLSTYIESIAELELTLLNITAAYIKKNRDKFSYRDLDKLPKELQKLIK